MLTTCPAVLYIMILNGISFLWIRSCVGSTCIRKLIVYIIENIINVRGLCDWAPSAGNASLNSITSILTRWCDVQTCSVIVFSHIGQHTHCALTSAVDKRWWLYNNGIKDACSCAVLVFGCIKKHASMQKDVLVF